MSTKDDRATFLPSLRWALARTALGRWDGGDLAALIADLIRRWGEGPDVLARAARLLDAAAAGAPVTEAPF